MSEYPQSRWASWQAATPCRWTPLLTTGRAVRIAVQALLVLRLALPMCIAAGTGTVSNDKVRLLQATVAPTPVIFGDPPSILRTVVDVRPVDSLGASSGSGPGGGSTDFTLFQVQVSLEFDNSTGQAVSTVTTQFDMAPPYSQVQLPVDPTLPSTSTGVPVKTFIQTMPWVAVDGRDGAGTFLLPGTYAYKAMAQLVRFKSTADHIHTTLVGTSGTLTGSVLLAPRPAPPSVAAMRPMTNVPLLVLSGTKPAGTDLLVNGVERLPLSAATSWTTTKTLIEGGNVIVVADTNVWGIQSLPTTVDVTLKTIPPAPPVLSTPPSYINTATTTLSGTKDAGSAVVVNGIVVVPANDSTTWTVSVTLQQGANSFLVQTLDGAGNLSLSGGSEVVGVARQKPVIGSLTALPPQVPSGQPVSISYRLFAQVPPIDDAALQVNVRVQDGSLVVRNLFSGVEQGSTTGPLYQALWDGRDDSGRAVGVNTSYRIVVSADRVNPTTMPAYMANANSQETAVVVTGSTLVSSPDKRLDVVYRPDAAMVTIQPSPPLPALAGRLLAVRGLPALGGSFKIASDRPLAASTVGVLHFTGVDGGLLRPFYWDTLQQDWMPIARSNWNPLAHALSFALPGPCTLVLASPADVTPPRISVPAMVGSALQIHVLDDGVGVNPGRIVARQGAATLTSTMTATLVNGVHDVLLSFPGFQRSQGQLQLYVEDWVGNGHLYFITTP